MPTAVLEKQGGSLISNDQPLLQEEEEKTPVLQGGVRYSTTFSNATVKLVGQPNQSRSETEMEE